MTAHGGTSQAYTPWMRLVTRLLKRATPLESFIDACVLEAYLLLDGSSRGLKNALVDARGGLQKRGLANAGSPRTPSVLLAPSRTDASIFIGQSALDTAPAQARQQRRRGVTIGHENYQA